MFSITNKRDEKYWIEGSYDDWLAEMAGDRLIIERFANITDGSVIGVRAPYLLVGANEQVRVVTQGGLFFLLHDPVLSLTLLLSVSVYNDGGSVFRVRRLHRGPAVARPRLAVHASSPHAPQMPWQQGKLPFKIASGKSQLFSGLCFCTE